MRPQAPAPGDPRAPFRGGIATRLRHVASSPFVRDVGVLSGSTQLGLALGFVQGLIAARWLGPGVYGRAVLIVATVELLFGIVDVRSTDTTIKFLHEYRARGDTERCAGIARLGYTIDGAMAALTIVIVASATGFISDLVDLGGGDAPWLLAYTASLLVRGPAATSRAIVTVTARFSVIARVELLSSALRTGAVILLLALGWGVGGVVAGNILYGASRGVAMTVIARRSARDLWGRAPWSGRIFALRGEGRLIARYVAFNDVAALVALVTKHADLIVVGSWAGPEAAGFYRVAKSAPDVWALAGGPLQAVSYERLARMAPTQTREGIRVYVKDLSTRIGLPFAGLVLLGIVFLEPAIRVAFGTDYLPAVTSARFFMASAAAGALFFWLRPLHLAIGEPGVWAAGNAMTALVFAAGGAVLLPRHGAPGLAAAFMIAHVAAAGALVARQWRLLGRAPNEARAQRVVEHV